MGRRRSRQLDESRQFRHAFLRRKRTWQTANELVHVLEDFLAYQPEKKTKEEELLKLKNRVHIL